MTNTSPLPEPSWSDLPRWRGFNLLNKFSLRWSDTSFKEEDFRQIASLGFNFVRLPMDYRTWIKNGKIGRIDEKAMKEIDQAVDWGIKYGIHVCINFHRAPGYCVNQPKEEKDLWTDPSIQKVCARHWAFFAKRYRKIPNRNLSFNLFNEPSGVDASAYAKVCGLIVKAIRRQDPNRLIIADGIDYGRTPVPELIPLKIAQAMRGYDPFKLTHYKAGWVQGSDRWPVPCWPASEITGYLYGPLKSEFRHAWSVRGRFPAGTTITVLVDTVSTLSHLVVKADGKTLGEKIFTPGPGTGEWERADFKPEWNIYQNVYNREYSFVAPSASSVIELTNAEGDWMSIRSVKFGWSGPEGGKEFILVPTNDDWGRSQPGLVFDPSDKLAPFKSTEPQDIGYLRDGLYRSWRDLQARGVGVMVGEWGAFNKTPHPVVLTWMKDLLDLWQAEGWGWALWNFTGSFGIVDSDRPDVAYEDWNGRRLDRRMLDLLQSR